MKSKIIILSMLLFSLPLVSSAQTLGYWQFDETGTVLKDSSGNGLDGNFGFEASVDTDPVSVSDSPLGEAGDRALDIIGAPVVVDDSENQLLDLAGQNFTAELWLKIDEDLNGLSWLGTVYYGRHGTGWGIGFRDSDVKFTLFGVVDIFPPGLQLTPDGEWHHLAFAFESEVGVEVFLDGESFAYIEETRPMIQTDTNILWLGAEDGGSRPLPGKMDRFRVTKGLLGASELDSDPANPKPVTDDTLAYFDFNEESGPEFKSEAQSGLTALVATQWYAIETAPDFVSDSPLGSGNALEFQRGDHVVVYDDDEDLNFQFESFTLEAWIKPSDDIPGTYAALLRYGGSQTAPDDSGGYGLLLNSDTGALRMTFYQIDAGNDANVDAVEGIVPIDDTWHHVAAVYDEELFMVRFFVDGELKDEIDYVLGIETAKDVYILHIGGQWDNRDPYVGKMDQVRISSGALTADELDYTEPVTPVLEWSLF